MARLTREESRQLTREKLRRSALAEFAQSGVGGASIDRISEAAGFSRGAFYANYSGKEDLLLDLMRERSEAEISRWSSFIDGTTSMDEVYRLMAEQFRQFVLLDEHGTFLVEAQLHAKRNPEFAAHFHQFRTGVERSSQAVMAAMFAKAGRRPPAPMAVVAAALNSLVTGVTLDIDPQKLAAEQIELFMRSVIELGTPLTLDTTDETIDVTPEITDATDEAQD